MLPLLDKLAAATKQSLDVTLFAVDKVGVQEGGVSNAHTRAVPLVCM